MEAVFNDKVLIALAMILYMGGIIGIGVYYNKRAHSSSDEYFLGGRSLGPYVTALSAGASDMSGWLLMGLPGLAYWSGWADPFWTAVGLGLGTYLNWLLVARPLRVYSQVAGNAVTIPDYFSNRFCENKDERKPILLISSIFILIFFVVYAASCFVTVGKLFSALFGFDYKWMMILGAIFVLAYTYLGGFLAESTSDFIQGVVMILALVIVLGVGTHVAGGFSAVIENAKQIPGFLSFFTQANPVLDASGNQVIEAGQPLFGEAKAIGWKTIFSSLSWGVGYFGVPQVLLRFMAINDPDELKVARRTGSIWAIVSLIAAVIIGVIGRILEPTAFTNPSSAENIFALLSQKLMPPFFAGIVMSGILAATISSADSYLLIAASAVSKNIYQGIYRKDASDQDVMKVTRFALYAITALGILFALDENSVIFQVVSIAWAGFGATFGPLMLVSLFNKNITKQGAIAGMLVGGGTVIIWNLFLKDLGGFFDLYELGPAFVLSLIAILLVSKMTEVPEDVAKQHAEYERKMKEG